MQKRICKPRQGSYELPMPATRPHSTFRDSPPDRLRDDSELLRPAQRVDLLVIVPYPGKGAVSVSLRKRQEEERTDRLSSTMYRP